VIVLFVLFAFGFTLLFTLVVGAAIAIGDTRYERIQRRIDDEVVSFAASLPEGFDADGIPY
jgi:hypothetical protein